ncbi:MAG: inorganic phosphate transporter [Bacteroidetes bacterium]|nr:inorganic phosphate transporter [Bacteroidota bacterium]
METLLIVVIALALIFDFINGFHDAANSIATVVSTKVLSPLTAVLWAAMFNFLAYWIFELKVADTVAKTVHADNITLVVVIAGLVAAIIWNLVTWWLGIPSSSSHIGGNDAQKVIGIIAAAMLSHGVITDIHHIPGWVPLACYSAIAAGTMVGGWKIVKTMGQKVTKLTPFEGFSAETAGAITLFVTQHFKIPVSTTHTITGSIIGVGLVKRISAVRWGVTIKLIWAWVLTIPISGLLAALLYKILEALIGQS